MDLILIVAGLVVAFITHNKRWLILSAIGACWFLVDVFLVMMRLVASG